MLSGGWKHCLANHLCDHRHLHLAPGRRLSLPEKKVVAIIPEWGLILVDQDQDQDRSLMTISKRGLILVFFSLHSNIKLQVPRAGQIRRLHAGQLRVLRKVFDGARGPPTAAAARRQEERGAGDDEDSPLQPPLTEQARQGWPPWQQQERGGKPLLLPALRHLQEARTQRSPLLRAQSHCQRLQRPSLSDLWSPRVLCSALPNHLDVQTGPADVPDHGGFSGLGRGVQGVAADQHDPGEGNPDGVEPSDLVHIHPAAAGSTGHQGLPQQGEVGRDQVLHPPHPRPRRRHPLDSS